MTPEEIIESGKLELYVCGALPTDEALEVENAIATYPEVKHETEQIEASLIHLSEAVSPSLQVMAWTNILNAIRGNKPQNNTKVRKINLPAITGWAAAIIFMGGILWMLQQNNDLNKSLKVTTIENTTLEEGKSKAETQLAETSELLNVLRSKEYQSYTLPGNQAVAPEAFAKVYLNKKESVAYIDTRGLPAAPRGKVYQVWSLKMTPLTPTSVGLILSGNQTGEGIYKFENFPDPEAFGITLEPEGGSESPTLSQLYILGKITI